MPCEAAVSRVRRATVDEAHMLIIRDKLGLTQEQNLRFAESFRVRAESNQQRVEPTKT